MKYRIAPLFCRPWTLNGMSPKLIESHYENNYGAALSRLNALTRELQTLDVATVPAAVISRLSREQTTLLNSTLLHELYFASLGGDGRAPLDTIANAITRDFGSVQRWRREFIALGEGSAGDCGWVLLTYVPRDGRLINQYAAEHSQAVASGVPILALDMYEHAYHMDFGANARAYAECFCRNIDWKLVEGRYEDALKVFPPRPLVQEEFKDVPSIGVEEMKAMMDSGQPVQVIDVRPKHSVSRSMDIADGATWRDPERVQEWIGELSKSEPVVVYCVYGFHVGCRTAMALRDAGFEAKYMTGGHSGWKAIGAPVKLKA